MYNLSIGQRHNMINNEIIYLFYLIDSGVCLYLILSHIIFNQSTKHEHIIKKFNAGVKLYSAKIIKINC